MNISRRFEAIQRNSHTRGSGSGDMRSAKLSRERRQQYVNKARLYKLMMLVLFFLLAARCHRRRSASIAL